LEKERNDLDAERKAFSEATQRLGEERRRLEVCDLPDPRIQLMPGRETCVARRKATMGWWTPKSVDISNSQDKDERGSDRRALLHFLLLDNRTTRTAIRSTPITVEELPTSIPISSITLITQDPLSPPASRWKTIQTP